MMFKKLSGCTGSPRPWAHHDPPLVSAQARAEAGYSHPALFSRAILMPSIVTKCFPWLSAISVGLHLKPLHYGQAHTATFAVLAFAVLAFDFSANVTALALQHCCMQVGEVRVKVLFQTLQQSQFLHVFYTAATVLLPP